MTDAELNRLIDMKKRGMTPYLVDDQFDRLVGRLKKAEVQNRIMRRALSAIANGDNEDEPGMWMSGGDMVELAVLKLKEIDS